LVCKLIYFKKEIVIMDSIKLENARLIFRNFAGEESKFNRAGNRNFCVVLPDDIAEELAEDGWNVKILQPRDEDDTPTSYLQVTVSYKNIPPKVYMVSGRTKTLLDEESISCLDYADVVGADLIIRPYHWEVNGKTGVKAYLKTGYIIVEQDEFASKYDYDEPIEDEDLPF